MSACCPTDKANQQYMDKLLEKRIAESCERGIECGLAEPELARAYFDVMATDIEKRSSEQVELMEAKIEGLR